MSEWGKILLASMLGLFGLAQVRRRVGAAGHRFGGGINAFSHYENGKTKPPLALVKLLEVLGRHPDLLNEVRTA